MTDEPSDEFEAETPEEDETATRSKLKGAGGSTKFGWCLTNHHEKCLVTVQKLTCTCPCPNHGTRRESLPGVSETFQALIDRYYPSR